MSKPRQVTPARRAVLPAQRRNRHRTVQPHTAGRSEPGTDGLNARVSPQRPQPVFSPARLRGYRHVRSLTHADVAAQTGMTTTDVQQIEKGQQTPTTSAIARLATALGCTVVDLYATDDAMNNEHYWDVKCAALPQLSEGTIKSVAATLDRIEARRNRRI